MTVHSEGRQSRPELERANHERDGSAGQVREEEQPARPQMEEREVAHGAWLADAQLNSRRHGASVASTRYRSAAATGAHWRPAAYSKPLHSQPMCLPRRREPRPLRSLLRRTVSKGTALRVGKNATGNRSAERSEPPRPCDRVQPASCPEDDHVLFLSPLVPIDALGEPRAWPTAEELDGVQRPFGNPPLAASGASLVEPVRGERGRAHEPVAGEDPRHVEIIDNDGSWSDSEFPSPAIAANPVPSSGREV